MITIFDCYHFIDPLIVVDVGRMGYEGEEFFTITCPPPTPYFQVST